MIANFPLPDLLAKLQIAQLNEMQQATLQQIDQHDELIVLSNTGSGKTIAFLLSILKQLDVNDKSTQAMVIAPSRELAMQIDDVFRKLGTQLKVCLCYGGHKREIEETNLIEQPVLIIGTAGRLADHIRRGSIKTEGIHTLVLDEYDKSIELGFLEELGYIIAKLPSIRKKILCSATEGKEIPEEIRVKNPVVVNYLVKDETATNHDLEIKKLLSPDKDKLETLKQLLCFAKNHPCIIFCNHRDAIERIASWCYERDIFCACYHGGMEQHERESELAMFRNGTLRILIATDLGARGLDIPGIRYIIHYHLPVNEESFTHRNGRTARMFDFGTSVLILSPEETLPDYVDPDIKTMEFPKNTGIPEDSPWTTLHFSVGKKDKVNKIDIVGFLSKAGELKQDDIGLIEVKDFYAFAAIRRKKAKEAMRLFADYKIKGKKVKISVARLYVSSLTK